MFDWITGFVARTGYAGVFLLMFGENLLPPIPSEVVMPLAGFTAAQGRLDIVGVVAAGTAGSLTGALAWYGVGRWLGQQRLKRFAARHGRWLTLTPEEVDRACEWFGRHGGKAVFLGRLVPAVRTLISLPAGFAAMPLPRFLAWTALGTLAWTALLAAAGYVLRDQYGRVAEVIEPATNAILAAVLAWYAWRVATFGRRANVTSRRER